MNYLRVIARKALPILAAFVLCTGCAVAAPVYVVNSFDDIAASPPLDNGVCETTPGSGKCTLRAAVMKANHGTPNATIRFQPGAAIYRLVISRCGGADESCGDLNIDQQMTIIGNGPQSTIIEGGPSLVDRIVTNRSGATIAGVTLRNGRGLGEGGAVRNLGSLLLRNCAVSDSAALPDLNGGSAFGGAIYNLGSIEIDNCTIARNTAMADSYGFAWGGGIYSAYNGYAMIRDSTISDNETAGGDGKGGDARGGGIAGTFNTYGSTITRNRSAKGGGIAAYGSSYPAFSPTLYNTTISGNVAQGSGGGLLLWYGSLIIVNVTIAANRANASADTGADVGGTGGGFDASAQTARLGARHSIIAGNEGRRTSGGATFTVDDDCAGSLSTADLNRLGAMSALCNLSGPVTVGNPNLGPLARNGGLTLTHFVPADPGLVDNAGACTEPYGSRIGTDQRGAARSASTCFVGAFEPTGASLDVDASAPFMTYDGLTDGVVLLRYLFGLSGTALTAGMEGTRAKRDEAAIRIYLNANRALFDVDGNGTVEALTDGLLIVRYLLGLRGAALVDGALGAEATQGTPELVENAIRALMP